MTDDEKTVDEQEELLFEHHRIVADPGQSPIRVDKFLMDRLPHVTRTKIQAGIHGGFVKVNEKPVKPNHKIHPHDIIVISLPEPPRDTDVVPEDIALQIVFEDNHLLIINKPAGMVVHPAYQNWSGTLVNALAFHFKQLPNLQEGRPGLVHRIDKDTSGLLVVAKTEPVLTALAKQFFDHTIERTYWALAWGEFDPPEGTIDVNIGRSPKDRRLTVAFPADSKNLSQELAGRKAITHYKVLKPLRYVSLVECRLETGRTHQIRAHLKYIGHPIFNDATYGGNEVMKGTVFTKYRQFVKNCFKIISRQALHAKTLGFIHPVTKEFLRFESELPEDFKAVVEKWEHYVKYS